MYKLLFLVFSVNAIMKILKTPILHFIPQLKLHHVIVIKENDTLLFAVDFTPINQSDFHTLKKLLLGKNVPAEIRIVPIYNVSFENNNQIILEWENKKEKRINLIDFPIFEEWNNKTMNLYNHNCQHFSNFFVSSMQ